MKTIYLLFVFIFVYTQISIAQPIGIYSGKGKVDYDLYEGQEIDQTKIADIQKNKTTRDEILVWFGTPAEKTKMGKDEIYTYKYCKRSGSVIKKTRNIAPIYSKSEMSSKSSDKICNELIIYIDSSGKVKEFNYKRNF